MFCAVKQSIQITVTCGLILQIQSQTQAQEKMDVQAAGATHLRPTQEYLKWLDDGSSVELTGMKD